VLIPQEHTMPTTPRKPLLAHLDQRGIALPVALLALVAVTLMVTTVMLTSSSEGAIARAHVDATQSLYDAETGLVRYAMAFAQSQTAFTAGTSNFDLAGTGRSVAVTRVRLSRQVLSDSSNYDTWALTAEGIRSGEASGRAVTAMVFQRTPSVNLGLNIASAITLGGDLDVNGNAFTVNGASAACRNDGGVQAVQMADSSQINVSGNENKWDNFVGSDSGQATSGQAAIDSSHLSRAALASQVLGGKTVTQIAQLVPASKKWCMSLVAGQCAYRSGSPLANRPIWPGDQPVADSISVIDGNGGNVNVHSGKGVLIITNGNLIMNGNDAFNGIIIVEGNFTLSGTPTVTGALISLAMNGQNSIVQDESAIAQGHVTVQFNQCTVNQAVSSFANQASPYTTSSTTFAWAEMVR
jgi:Tfp pilus assembly protein PilX